MPPLIDLSGRRLGRLRVLGRAGAGNDGHPLWACRCACGWEGAKAGPNLRAGRVRSCGSAACRAATWRAGRGDRRLAESGRRVPPPQLPASPTLPTPPGQPGE